MVGKDCEVNGRLLQPGKLEDEIVAPACTLVSLRSLRVAPPENFDDSGSR